VKTILPTDIFLGSIYTVKLLWADEGHHSNSKLRNKASDEAYQNLNVAVIGE
jgi:hypothetical protein